MVGYKVYVFVHMKKVNIAFLFNSFVMTCYTVGVSDVKNEL